MNDINKWFQDNGDYTHRLNYDLNENSIVVDLGGYNGWFVEQINNKFNSKIYVFEPINEYYNNILNKFNSYKNIKIFHNGISDKNGDDTIYINNDASSLYVSNGNPEKIRLITFDEFLKNENIKKIDLLKINIEGVEYKLLKDIINKNLHIKIDNIQVQFHKFIDNYETIYDEIVNDLSKTHKKTFYYPFIWENWKLNN